MSEPRWEHALITGASAGLGECYARALAPHCANLTLVARRGERLQALAQSLPAPCAVEVLALDLCTQEGLTAVVEHMRQRVAVDLLVNNAGFSTLGPFAGSEPDAELAMCRLHQEVPLVLTRAALPGMLQADRGAIINVSSMAAFLPLPGVATYAATKAFLLSFSRSLQSELQDTSLQVQCLCPGYTRTEIHSRESFAGFDVSLIPEALWMEPAEVVKQSLAALGSGQTVLVPGADNRERVRKGLQSMLKELED